MKTHFTFPIHPLLLAVIVSAGIFTTLGTAYAVSRNAAKGEVMGRVEVDGTQLGGLSREKAIDAVLSIEDRYLARAAVFTIEGADVTIDPPEAGLDLDEDAIVDNAMKIGREGNAAFQFLWWLGHIFDSVDVELIGSTAPEALSDLFDEWDATVINEPASPGGIVLNANVPHPVYPEAGTGVDREASAEIIEGRLLSAAAAPAELPTSPIAPKLTDADIDEALREAKRLLAGPITLLYDGKKAVFTPEQLREAFLSETIDEGAPRIVNSFDPEVVNKHINPIRAEYEAPPVDARFVVSGDSITIDRGSRGTRIDQSETAEALAQAGRSRERVGSLPLVRDADPDVTAAHLESLGINHLVSSFTTYHSCCENRVVNIQKMADTIDGHIVPAGEKFSINDFVGQRTSKDGYLPAGTIVSGEMKNTVGGGVSQFATTFYNAVFWAGLEDVEHKPHSYYFSRYPEGIEATVNWRAPDLVFRNNTDHAVMLDTQHTGTSITVRIFGDNDGRILKGEQSKGATHLTVVDEGGPEALHIEAVVSDRFAARGPGAPRLKANPAITDPEKRVRTQGERSGWSVTVTRYIRRGGTQLVDERKWTVRYRPRFAVFEVHPCMADNDPTDCVPPSTTTTTTPTTAPPPATQPKAPPPTQPKTTTTKPKPTTTKPKPTTTKPKPTTTKPKPTTTTQPKTTTTKPKPTTTTQPATTTTTQPETTGDSGS